MADDILVSSDDEYGNKSSDDETPSMLEFPDDVTYRFPTEICVLDDNSSAIPHGLRKLQIKLKRCTDKLCAFASYGNTRLCCNVNNPINEADIEDFKSGVSVKVSGVSYIDELTLRDLIQCIIPTAHLKRTFFAIRFYIYSDCGGVVPASLMTVMFALSALAVEVKGIVTAATVLVNPEGNLTVDPNKELEQKARDNIPGYAYVTAMKIMKDDHIRWFDMEGLPKSQHLPPAMKKAGDEASGRYSQMSKMVKVLAQRGKDYEGVIG